MNALLLLALLLLWPATAAAQTAVTPAVTHRGPPWPALTSYQHGPFVTGNGSGLAKLLVALVNDHLPPSHRLQIEVVPRRRLNEAYLSRAEFQGVALFLSPVFMSTQLGVPAHWSRPLLMDENVLVFGRRAAVTRWEELRGLTLGGVQGHLYVRLDPLAAAGWLVREDAPDQFSSLGKLCLDRVDFALMSLSEYRHLPRPAVCTRPLVAVSLPDPMVFERRVLIAGSPAFTADLVQAIDRVVCHPVWLQALRSHDLMPAPCPRPGSIKADKSTSALSAP